MFCKFCGNQIDPTSRLCPECGERQADRCDGNGFWDIFSQKEPSAPMEESVVVDTKKTDTLAKQAKKSNMRKTPMRQRLSLVLSLICLLYVFISSAIMHLRIQILEQEIKTVTAKLDRQTERTPYAYTSVPSSEPVEATAVPTVAETERQETAPEIEPSPETDTQATDSFQDQPEPSDGEQRN